MEDKLKGSLDASDAGILKSAQNLLDSFITQLEAAGAKSQATKTAVDELTTSILATGTKSADTAAERAQLITDLVMAGLSAQNAAKLVDGFITEIGKIPSSKTVARADASDQHATFRRCRGELRCPLRTRAR